MDISKLRKKHKEAQEKPGPKALSDKPEEKSFPVEPASEAIEEFKETPKEEEPTLGEEDLEAEYATAIEVKSHEVKAQAPAPRIPAKTEDALTGIAELLVFKLSEELYAFRVTEVAEVLRLQRISKVPRTVDFIPGVTSLRGKIIPVMDIKKRLNIDSGSKDKPANIVILKGTDRGLIGVLVDKTIDVIRVPEKELMQPPSHLGETEARFIEGVAAQKESFISIIQPVELLDFNAGDIR